MDLPPRTVLWHVCWMLLLLSRQTTAEETEYQTCEGLADGYTDMNGEDMDLSGQALSGTYCNIGTATCTGTCSVTTYSSDAADSGTLRIYANQISIAGHLSADAAGYAGGAKPTSESASGSQGDGPGGGQGGAGESGGYGHPGGGGGHGTAGDQSGAGSSRGGEGGSAYHSVDSWPSNIQMGSGGGSGGNDNALHDNPQGGLGGSGGGIIVLSAGIVIITGSVTANGGDGEGDGTTENCQSGNGHSSASSCWDFSGPGGGGAGGSIYIATTAFSGEGSTAVAGGLGGAGCDCSSEKSAGNGGEGLYKIYIACPTFGHTANAAISGHNTETLSSVTVRECEEACCSRDWCVSFDYFKNSDACDLSNTTAEQAGGLRTDYTNDPYDHYDRYGQDEGSTTASASTSIDEGSTSASASTSMAAGNSNEEPVEEPVEENLSTTTNFPSCPTPEQAKAKAVELAAQHRASCAASGTCPNAAKIANTAAELAARHRSRCAASGTCLNATEVRAKAAELAARRRATCAEEPVEEPVEDNHDH